MLLIEKLLNVNVNLKQIEEKIKTTKSEIKDKKKDSVNYITRLCSDKLLLRNTVKVIRNVV